MALQESGEMYLETILILSRQKGAVRSVDISEYMGYSKPSVSRAVGLLKSGNYITIQDDGYIYLTPEGRQIAEDILNRHTLLTEMLVKIGVSRETASADACKMEHILSEETFEAIKNILKYSTQKNHN
ncbi:MAG: metal-dependent transcriptional regulator [Ruminococcaceae bacterium]|nr:metal-dependent transcriptional regulator [Oscillospiraceae bacterium]